MKKLIIILLLISTSAFAQTYPVERGIDGDTLKRINDPMELESSNESDDVVAGEDKEGIPVALRQGSCELSNFDLQAAMFDSGIFSGMFLKDAIKNKAIYEKRINYFSDILSDYPQDLLSRNYRGNLYLYKGDYDKAIVDFTEMHKTDPNNWLAIYCRGLAYLMRGNYDKAMEDMAVAIQMHPEDPKIGFYGSVAYYCQGEKEKAEEIFGSAKLKFGFSADLTLAEWLKGGL